jgi:hypothetical protein
MGVQVALRVGAEATSNVVPISGTWPIPILTVAGEEYDRVLVQTSNGQANFTYTLPAKTGKCFLSELGLDKVAYNGTTYQIRLAGPVEFYVGRKVE